MPDPGKSFIFDEKLYGCGAESRYNAGRMERSGESAGERVLAFLKRAGKGLSVKESLEQNPQGQIAHGRIRLFLLRV